MRSGPVRPSLISANLTMEIVLFTCSEVAGQQKNSGSAVLLGFWHKGAGLPYRHPIQWPRGFNNGRFSVPQLSD
jgi:hypothetical protein